MNLQILDMIDQDGTLLTFVMKNKREGKIRPDQDLL